MNKTIAILQSNYIPWKGYFDLINMVDEFIVYDTAQYTKRDWRNRNQIKTSNGLKWLSIPVDTKGKYDQQICETKVSDRAWAEQHLKSILHTYSKAKYFSDYKQIIWDLYEDCAANDLLSEINYCLISGINNILGIKTKIISSVGTSLPEGKTEKLIALCESIGATRYISGPAAKDYIDHEQFSEARICLEYKNYSGYKEYPQLYPEIGFMHNVTILDLIFNMGPETINFLQVDKSKEVIVE